MAAQNISGASLADGQLASSKGDLYTVPADTVAHVSMISLANTSSSVAYTTNIYLKRSGGTSRRLIGNATPLPASDSLQLNLGLRLSAGDKIEGDASTASVVDYFISGGTSSTV